MSTTPSVTLESLSAWAKADRKRRRIEDRTCPKCGSLMDFEPADAGEPPSGDYPMGGAPARPATWFCLGCDHTEEARDE